MKLHIMTWNIAITEKLKSTNIKDTFFKIINYIMDFLTKDNAIVFLQQMVYKDQNEWNEWNEHEFYNEFVNKFGKDYDIKFYEKASFMMTVAMAKKDTMTSLKKEYYSQSVPTVPRNREIAVEFNGITFLGIHAENGEKNKKHLEALRGRADVILGDFNAGNYMQSENRHIFNNILKEHICICNMPTKVIYTQNNELIRKSCIDHIFVREDMVTLCSNLIVHENIALSDHYPITFEINF